MAVLPFAVRFSSHRVLLAKRSLSRRARFAIGFAEMLFVALCFAEDDMFHVEDVGFTSKMSAELSVPH